MINLKSNYKKPTRGLVVVWSVLSSLPYPGITWHRLQFLAGLRRMGFDVWYVEASDREMLTPDTFWKCVKFDKNIEYLSRHMDMIGLGNRWVFKPPWQNEICYGATNIKGLNQLYGQADIVINHTGAQVLDESHEKIKCLVYLETDPVEKQIHVYNGDNFVIDQLSRHHYHFTFGTNIGRECFTIPLKHFKWHPILPGVCVDWWENGYEPKAPHKFTTVATFKHDAKDIAFQNKKLRWSKHSQFDDYLSLPKMVDTSLELSLGGIGTSSDQVEKLSDNGWHIKSAKELNNIFSYRDYIVQSSAEFTVAKEQYVKPCSGWFSDRSATYLASGRPVVTQNTGFELSLPTGIGLFSFQNQDEAIDSINKILSNYERNSRAAIEIATEYFSIEKVFDNIFKKIAF